MYSNLYDFHTHSNNSFDGNHSIDEICLSMIDKGAKGIAFTDHCDIDGMMHECWSFQDKQFDEVAQAKIKFKDKLQIFSGVELGQGIFVQELSEKFIANYDFDFVLGSIHNLKNMEDFYFLDYSNFDIDNLLEKYFNNVLELTNWKCIDSIAHLTYPLRYIVAREHIDIDLSKFQEVMDNILLSIIRNNKALELNVSGLSMDMNDTLPNKSIIKRYHELGGKYVTVGSDSHYKETVCQDIDKGYDILKECGFNEFTVFVKRKPKLITIK